VRVSVFCKQRKRKEELESDGAFSLLFILYSEHAFFHVLGNPIFPKLSRSRCTRSNLVPLPTKRNEKIPLRKTASIFIPLDEGPEMGQSRSLPEHVLLHGGSSAQG